MRKTQLCCILIDSQQWRAITPPHTHTHIIYVPNFEKFGFKVSPFVFFGVKTVHFQLRWETVVLSLAKRSSWSS